LFRLVWDENRRKGIPAVLKWFDTISSHPAYLNHFGRSRMVKSAMHPFEGEI